MSVPVWRMRQLQDVEHTARTVVELIALNPNQRNELVDAIKDQLTEALDD
jgi:hypothetical protein